MAIRNKTSTLRHVYSSITKIRGKTSVMNICFKNIALSDSKTFQNTVRHYTAIRSAYSFQSHFTCWL